MTTFLLRAIGQLPVGRKLLLIYLLDLTAVIYISGILINEKYISIDFSRKELAGNAYIAEVRDVLVALPTPLPTPQASSSAPAKAAPLHLARAQWEPRLAALRAAEVAHGEGMKSADVNAAFIDALRTAMGKPVFEVSDLAMAMVAGRELLSGIGNQSNLILDPDLDSYYTMSIVLLRLVELQDVLAQDAYKAVELKQASPDQHHRLHTELLILEGRLDAALTGTESDYAEALAAGTPVLRTTIDPTREKLVHSVHAFRAAQSELGNVDVSAARALMAKRHAEVRAVLHETWQAAGVGLDAVIQERVDGLNTRMWVHLGTAVACCC